MREYTGKTINGHTWNYLSCSLWPPCFFSQAQEHTQNISSPTSLPPSPPLLQLQDLSNKISLKTPSSIGCPLYSNKNPLSSSLSPLQNISSLLLGKAPSLKSTTSLLKISLTAAQTTSPQLPASTTALITEDAP